MSERVMELTLRDMRRALPEESEVVWEGRMVAYWREGGGEPRLGYFWRDCFWEFGTGAATESREVKWWAYLPDLEDAR